MEGHEAWEKGMLGTENEVIDQRLTKDEAVAVELVHHGLQGKSVKEAAETMGVKELQVYRLLDSAKLKAPSLFPILTPEQAKVLFMYSVEGLSVNQIAMCRGTSERAVRYILSKLRQKGELGNGAPRKRPLSFDERTMSHLVVHKW